MHYSGFVNPNDVAAQKAWLLAVALQGSRGDLLRFIKGNVYSGGPNWEWQGIGWTAKLAGDPLRHTKGAAPGPKVFSVQLIGDAAAFCAWADAAMAAFAQPPAQSLKPRPARRRATRPKAARPSGRKAPRAPAQPFYGRYYGRVTLMSPTIEEDQILRDLRDSYSKPGLQPRLDIGFQRSILWVREPNAQFQVEVKLRFADRTWRPCIEIIPPFC